MGQKENARGTTLRKLLDLYQIPYYRIHCGLVKVKGGWMHNADAGWPDYGVPLPKGRTVYFETKSEKGVLSESQRNCHKMLAKLGHKVIVVKSLDDVPSWETLQCLIAT